MTRAELIQFLASKYIISNHQSNKIILLNVFQDQVIKIGCSIFYEDTIKKEQEIFKLSQAQKLDHFFEPLIKLKNIFVEGREVGVYTQKYLIIEDHEKLEDFFQLLLKQYSEEEVYQLYLFCKQYNIKDLVLDNFGLDPVIKKYKIIDYTPAINAPIDNLYFYMEKYFIDNI